MTDSERLERILRSGWALVSYFDANGTLCTGFIEKELVEAGRGGDHGEVMIELDNAITKPEVSFINALLGVVENAVEALEHFMGSND